MRALSCVWRLCMAAAHFRKLCQRDGGVLVMMMITMMLMMMVVMVVMRAPPLALGVRTLHKRQRMLLLQGRGCCWLCILCIGYLYHSLHVHVCVNAARASNA